MYGASNVQKQPTGCGPDGCVESGPAAVSRLQDRLRPAPFLYSFYSGLSRPCLLNPPLAGFGSLSLSPPPSPERAQQRSVLLLLSGRSLSIIATAAERLPGDYSVH